MLHRIYCCTESTAVQTSMLYRSTSGTWHTITTATTYIQATAKTENQPCLRCKITRYTFRSVSLQTHATHNLIDVLVTASSSPDKGMSPTHTILKLCHRTKRAAAPVTQPETTVMEKTRAKRSLRTHLHEIEITQYCCPCIDEQPWKL